MIRYDWGGWISGRQDRLYCNDRIGSVAGGEQWIWCALDPDHVDRGEPHESADYEWDDQMLFARLKEQR